MEFVIRTDIPFRGTAQSTINADGKVAWSGDLTVAEYQKARGFPVRVVDEPEFLDMQRCYIDTLITAPVRESRAAYWNALEILPPSRFTDTGAIELFHISEHIQADLVEWHAKTKGTYFSFRDRYDAPLDYLLGKIREAAPSLAPAV